MKIQVLSDTHLEFFNRSSQIDNFVEETKTNADVLILAGDICTLNKKIDYIEHYFNLVTSLYSNVIWIAGNHEYYHNAFIIALSKAREISYSIPNLKFLENESILIDNVMFYGTTLWFKKTPEAISNRFMSNDFNCIHNFNPYGMNTLAIEFIKEIDLDKNNKSVLITHHLPSYKCLKDPYSNDVFNYFLVSDIESELNKFNLVVHGHSHNSTNFHINETKIICNPYGYLGDNEQFNPNLIIEI